MDSPIDDRFITEDAPFFPKETVWEHRGELCGLECSYVPLLKRNFINSWEVSICMPFAVLFIIISSYVVYLTVCAPNVHFDAFYNTISITIFMFFFIISYIFGILEGPGYLPYYYPYRIPERKGNKKDYLSGLVTTKEQLDFIVQSPPLHRAGYFRSAHRIVLRPDHYCDWFASFIGRKNHKLFMHFNFWGVIYITDFLAFVLQTIIDLTKSKEHPLYIGLLGIYLILAVTFLILTMMFLGESVKNLSIGITSFDEMKMNRNKGHIERRSTSCIESWEEVFGPRKKWYLWLLPIPAFHNVDEYDLIGGGYSEKIL